MRASVEIARKLLAALAVERPDLLTAPLPEIIVKLNGQPNQPTLSEMEQDVLEALGTKRLTGEQLAPLAGYPWDSRFRSCLAAMVRHRILANKRPGYERMS